MQTEEKFVDILFEPPASRLVDRRALILPGPSPDLAQTLVDLLKANHQKFHCYLNFEGHHNHMSHHLLALFALNAPGNILERTYAEHSIVQRHIFLSPEKISSENWKEHLGDETYYNSYLEFFTSEVLRHDIKYLLETYVFSPAANFEDSSNEPRMLARLMSGAIHPVIHLGYGLEFGILGMTAEGLAHVAIHNDAPQPLLPKEFFFSRPSIVEPGNVSSGASTTNGATTMMSAHAFDILFQIMQDEALAPGKASNPDSIYVKQIDEVLEMHAHALQRYLQNWRVEHPSDIESKLEELIYLSVLIFGVGGWQQDKPFNADFFTLHIVTAALFIPQYLPYIDFPAASDLLRAFLGNAIVVWLARGRPPLPISQFMSSTAADPRPPAGTQSTNPWFDIVHSSISHNGGKLYGEHLIKAQRALMHFASTYGTHQRGRFNRAKLPGAADIDGTLFIRVAGVLMDRMGWLGLGDDEPGVWDRDGFFSGH